jgi:hypothetical protein
MATLLGALLRNESGGRNVANTTQGTSSGQAQGYFQITTGTWNEFGGDKYAPNPMQASYAQQADIASKIPLSRWDSSTLNAMRGTGKPIDPHATLGENLSRQGEGFGSSPDVQNKATSGFVDKAMPTHAASVASPQAATDVAGPSQQPVTPSQTPLPAPGQPGGAMGPANPPGYSGPPAQPTAVASAQPAPQRVDLAKEMTNAFSQFGKDITGAGTQPQLSTAAMAMPKAALSSSPEIASVDPQQQQIQQQRMALALQRLNAGRLV